MLTIIYWWLWIDIEYEVPSIFLVWCKLWASLKHILFVIVTGSLMAKFIFWIDWWIEICKLDFFKDGFDILRLDIFCYYVQPLFVFVLHLWKGNCLWVCKFVVKTWKYASKTNHNVGIIQKAVLSSNFFIHISRKIFLKEL